LIKKYTGSKTHVHVENLFEKQDIYINKIRHYIDTKLGLENEGDIFRARQFICGDLFEFIDFLDFSF